MSTVLRFARAPALVCLVALTACSGGSGGDADAGASRTAPIPPTPGESPDPISLTGLEIAPSGAEGLVVPVGTTVRLTAIGTYSDASTADVTGEVVWSSSNASAAAFSTEAGSASVLEPAAAGTTAVTATHPAGLVASVAVTVAPLPLDSDPANAPLAISPDNPTILLGTTIQLQAWGTLSDLSLVDYSGMVIWSSSDPAVATISPTGLASAIALGATTITATDPFTGTSDTTTLTVTDVPAALGYVVLSRGSVVGGSPNPVTGTVVLTSHASESVTILLSTSAWKTEDAIPEAEVPASVVVTAGTDRATFAVSHHPVTRRTRVAVRARDENQVPAIEKRASLWLRPDR